MPRLCEIIRSVFDKGFVIAEIYKSGEGHFLFKTMIEPFMEEMKNANNIILFVDEENNVTGGQIGLYSSLEGLKTILF